MDLILIEIVSVVSFIYSLLLMFFPFTSLNKIFIVFIWTNLSSLIFALNYKRKKIYNISILLLLLPLLFFKDIVAITFILMNTILMFLYIRNSLLQGNHYEYSEKLKKSYLAYIAAITLAFLGGVLDNFIVYSIPFIIISQVTTIILIRTVRHLDSGMDMENIKRSNRKYIGVVSILSSMVALDGLRNIIFSIVGNIYRFIIDVIIKILYYPIILIFYLMNKLIVFIEGEIKKNNMESLFENMNVDNYESIEQVEEIIPRSFPMLERIIGFLLIITTIYIIYRLIVKVGYREYNAREYTEEREYIKDIKIEKKKTREKYPKEIKEQIRFYYRRYLEKLNKRDIEIKKSDTSLDINKKAEKFSEERIEKIRKIYIDSRYGDKDADKKVVEEMENLYKKL
ncbi:hypothetical protein RBU61_16895 [Tissierella sp. MB52-C2]|uniref:hypothetical protein n=1 Tax=Tissierella sp. MB52-C2 TaxID=3070999 RepID=UPI00280B6A16|nr:hypothetical protein [Tissierella sp. MB52-C2]WMM24588.1 hypothetical protein RBU61_16895 [Tissierella sp. MB52-C2]